MPPRTPSQSHHSVSDDDRATGSQYVDRARQWFDSLWGTLGRTPASGDHRSAGRQPAIVSNNTGASVRAYADRVGLADLVQHMADDLAATGADAVIAHIDELTEAIRAN
ncbi:MULTISPECIES: hypothetical protein [unclassified Kribbella]|uniref:hypothetical protein n=1 Tax=unclassified Kribbella TaxID=2644121 RepID=UPI0033FE13A3